MVYVAFPFHYVSASERNQLIENAIKWLATSYYAKVALNASAYLPGWAVEIAATVYNGTSPLADANVTASIYFPNGSLAATINLTSLGNGSYVGYYAVPDTAPIGNYSVVVKALSPDGVPSFAKTTFKVVTGIVNFTIKLENFLVEAGVVKFNITVSTGSDVVVTKVEYRIDMGSEAYTAEPCDGAYDEPTELVTVTVDANNLTAGEHVINVRAHCELGSSSSWSNYTIIVRDLAARYNLIALTVPPPKPMNASDLARAVGPKLMAVWRWDVEAQEFRGYVPGVSGPEDDFRLEMGIGYFVYLSEPAKLVEVKV